MAIEIYLGKPPADIEAWISTHAQPAGHAETWYKYAGDTEWRTTMIGGEIALLDEEGTDPTGQIDNPLHIVAIDIGTGPQENQLTSIGNYAFKNCNDLSTIIIPNTVTTIKQQAFYDCGNLKNITISNQITSIGDYAFYGCNDFQSIVIPSSVTSIGSDAFYDLESYELTSVVFQGKTLSQVQQMGNYPWGIEDTSIITVA